MNRLRAVVLLLASVAALLLAGCGKKTPEPAPPTPGVSSAHGEQPSTGPSGATPGPAGPMPGGMPPGMGGSQVEDATPPGATATSAAGLRWTKPGAWGLEPARSMRVATYRIAAVGGDPEPASCAVYYFGPGQGGGVDANLSRWIEQFQPARDSKRSTRTVNGVSVSLADASGTYTAHGGAMMQPQGDVPNWRLLGAIAEGPEGTVFFKLTGPEKTVAAAKGAFDGMIGSIQRQ